MKRLFNIEMAAAKTVVFSRTDAALLLLLAAFLLYITPSTALQASRIIARAYKESFDVLISFGLMKTSNIAAISAIMGTCLAILVETAGVIFTFRGRHLLGLFFTSASSVSALTAMLHTFHYSDSNAITDIVLSIFLTTSPVVITYVIGVELSSRSNSTQESLLATYSTAVYEKMTAGVKSTIAKFKL